MVASEVVREVSQGASLEESGAARSGTATGLGKGLDGILDDALVGASDSGLLQLLGVHDEQPPQQLRQFVADAAVAVVAAKFDARAVWLLGVNSKASLDLVSTHLPPRWSHTSASSLEIAGRLWQSLSMGAGISQASIGPEQVLICSQRFESSSFAVAVVRGERFASDEQETLSSFLRSVSVAITGGRSDLLDVQLEVAVRETSQVSHAEVAVSFAGRRRQADRQAGSGPLAVAQAAAALCDARCSVAYAGEVLLQKQAVTIVVVLDETDSPMVGLAVQPASDHSGPARAVFSAMVTIAGQPFAELSRVERSP